jgi:hypothetical protein
MPGREKCFRGLESRIERIVIALVDEEYSRLYLGNREYVSILLSAIEKAEEGLKSDLGEDAQLFGF